MVHFMFLVGICIVVLGIVLGLFSGSFWWFAVTLTISIVVAVIFFTLSKLLENQEIIILEIEQIKSNTKKAAKIITCEYCSKEYSEVYSSCPHCGRKPNK